MVLFYSDMTTQMSGPNFSSEHAPTSCYLPRMLFFSLSSPSLIVISITMAFPSFSSEPTLKQNKSFME